MNGAVPDSMHAVTRWPFQRSGLVLSIEVVTDKSSLKFNAVLNGTMHQNVTYNTVRSIYGYWSVILLEDRVQYGVYRENDLSIMTPSVHCICVKLYILTLV
jgi:hypothetical protein